MFIAGYLIYTFVNTKTCKKTEFILMNKLKNKQENTQI